MIFSNSVESLESFIIGKNNMINRKSIMDFIIFRSSMKGRDILIKITYCSVVTLILFRSQLRLFVLFLTIPSYASPSLNKGDTQPIYILEYCFFFGGGGLLTFGTDFDIVAIQRRTFSIKFSFNSVSTRVEYFQKI